MYSVILMESIHGPPRVNIDVGPLHREVGRKTLLRPHRRRKTADTTKISELRLAAHTSLAFAGRPNHCVEVNCYLVVE